MGLSRLLHIAVTTIYFASFIACLLIVFEIPSFGVFGCYGLFSFCMRGARDRLHDTYIA